MPLHTTYEERATQMKTIVLASGSPQRSALLSQLRLPFVTMKPDIHEDADHVDPAKFAALVSRDKAVAVLKRIIGSRVAARRDAVSEDMLVVSRLLDGGRLWILGADTLIDLDGEILGKPPDEIIARSMLVRLSGRRHIVITGICLIRAEVFRMGDGFADSTAFESAIDRIPGVQVSVDSVATTVTFGALGDSEIDRYIESGDWREAAGGYRIQSLGAALVERIDGSYTNVVGLPLRRFCGMLQQYGYYE